jgi:hypothetical protein
MESSRREQRYRIAVHLVLLSLALVFATFGVVLNRDSNSFPDLLLNLAAETAGAVLLYFVFKFFLLDGESSIVTKLETIISLVRREFTPLVWERLAGDQFVIVTNLFSTHLSGAKSMYALGYNHEELLRGFRKLLIESIRAGLQVRILLVDPNSAARDLLLANSHRKEWVDQHLENSFQYIAEIMKSIDGSNSRGSLDVRVISWIPSCSLVILNHDQDTGIARVAIHPPSINQPPGESRKRLNLILKQEECPEEFEYFRTSFEFLWDGETTREAQIVAA